MPDHTPPTDARLAELEQLIARTTPVGAVTASPGLLGLLLAEVRRQRAELAEVRAELERPAVELKRNEIRLSYRQLAVQAREDRDYEGEATVLKQLADHEEQWKREGAAANADDKTEGAA